MAHFSKLEEIRDRLEQLENVSEFTPAHELRSRLVKLREQRSILLGIPQSRARDGLLDVCDAGIMRHDAVLRRQQRLQGAISDASPLSSSFDSSSSYSSMSSYGSYTPDSPGHLAHSFQSPDQNYDFRLPYPESLSSYEPRRLARPHEMFQQAEVSRHDYPQENERGRDHFPKESLHVPLASSRGVSVERRRRELRPHNSDHHSRTRHLTDEERQVRERMVTGVRDQLRHRMLNDSLFEDPQLDSHEYHSVTHNPAARQFEQPQPLTRSRSAQESVRSVSNASTVSMLSSSSNNSVAATVGSNNSRSSSRPRNGIDRSNYHQPGDLSRTTSEDSEQAKQQTANCTTMSSDTDVLHMHMRDSTGPVRPPPPIMPEAIKSTPSVPTHKWDPISEAHRYFELTHGMMLGIRTSVGKTQAKPSSTLFASHFTESFASKFPAKPSCSARTPGHKMSDFWFKDYAPEVFRRIRKRFGLDCATYLTGVCGNKQYLEFVSNSKSGEFFFFSHDEQFMIKTISHAEVQALRALLPKYYHHIKANKDTLITRFFGLHRVQVDTIRSFGRVKKVYFLIMGSVFFTPSKKPIHLQFDLKGSLHGRSAGPDAPPGAILKDKDLLGMNIKIRIGKENAAKLNLQIAKDVALLREAKIMDYSLLLGIHYPDAVEDGKSARQSLRVARNSIRLVDHPLELQKFMFSEGRAGDFSGLQSPVGTPDLSSLASERGVTTGGGGSPDIVDPSEVVPAASCWSKDDGGFQSPEVDPARNTRPVYFMGIIDTLIQYGTLKKLETRYKAHKNDPWELSAVDPVTYAERFKRYLADIIV